MSTSRIFKRTNVSCGAKQIIEEIGTGKKYFISELQGGATYCGPTCNSDGSITDGLSNND